MKWGERWAIRSSSESTHRCIQPSAGMGRGPPADCGPCGLIAPVCPTLSPPLLFPPPAWAPTLVIPGPWNLRPPRRALLTALHLGVYFAAWSRGRAAPGHRGSGLHSCQWQTPPPAGHRSRPERSTLPPLPPPQHSHLDPRSGSSSISHFFDYLCENLLSFTDLEGLSALSPSRANTGPTPSPFICFPEL